MTERSEVTRTGMRNDRWKNKTNGNECVWGVRCSQWPVSRSGRFLAVAGFSQWPVSRSGRFLAVAGFSRWPVSRGGRFVVWSGSSRACGVVGVRAPVGGCRRRLPDGVRVRTAGSGKRRHPGDSNRDGIRSRRRTGGRNGSQAFWVTVQNGCKPKHTKDQRQDEPQTKRTDEPTVDRMNQERENRL